MSLDTTLEPQHRPADGEVSPDRLADVINDILSGPALEGLGRRVETQIARAAEGPGPSGTADAQAAEELGG